LKQRIGILWFRQDLRLSDNIALSDAIKSCDQIIPVYIFDERLFTGISRFGFSRIGIHRAKFILDSVADLRHSLRDLGTDLIVRYGKPEEILFEFALKYKTSWVFCNRERTQEEEFVQDTLEQNLWSIGQEVRYSRGKMLYHTGDLPFPVTHTPDTYASFYREVGKIIPIREVISKPDFIPLYLANIEAGNLPKLEELGFSNDEINGAEFKFKGGESTGLQRIDAFIELNLKSGKTIHAHNWEEMRNSQTTHLAPYLSIGNISARQLYNKLNKYSEHKKYKKRVKCLIHGLIRRDFYRLMTKKYRNNIFLVNGIKGEATYILKKDLKLFSLWANAKTGMPMVDAFMRELNKTGYISPEGRYFVASFLVEEMKLNWQMGAEYFESKLVDYDPSSNWVNWNHIGGVSLDSKEDRYCNIVTRAKKIDPNGDFIREWLPELAQINSPNIHEPYKLDKDELAKYALELGKDYPTPIVETEKWI
jgi:deoxyribodipyrimidine photo-lyase